MIKENQELDLTTRPIQANEKYKTFVKTYSGQEADPDHKLWSTQHELVMFSSNLGFRLKNKIKLSSKKFEIVPRNAMTTNSDHIREHILILSTADKKNKDILKDNDDMYQINFDERYKIYQSYLNGGLDLLKLLTNQPGEA